MKIKNNIDWFNNLEENKREYSLDYLLGKEVSYKNLSHQDRKRVSDLQEEVKLLIDKCNEKEEVLNTLISLGFEQKTAKIVYDNAMNYNFYIADVKLINLIDDELFSELISYLFDKFLLRGIYDNISTDSFSGLNKFEKTDHARIILEVIKIEILNILARNNSIKELKAKLIWGLQFDKSKVNILIKKIEDNKADLESAFITKTLISIEEKTDYLFDCLDITNPREHHEIDKILKEGNNNIENFEEKFIFRSLMDIRSKLFYLEKENKLIFNK
ncbi:MAG: hypothetical protein ACOCP8_05320 [archaeon]